LLFFLLGYIKNNQPNKAIHLFNQIQNPNDVHFMLLFNACAQLRSNEGLNLIKTISQKIPKSFYSNRRLLTSLLDALIKCDDLIYAQSLFDTSTKKDSGIYAVMMNGYNKGDNPLKTLQLFHQMETNQIEKKSNSIIYLCVIKALSQIGDYELSQSTIQQIPNHFLLDNQIKTALIDMWVSLKRIF
jgi:pentatricopeptide repeat protein